MTEERSKLERVLNIPMNLNLGYRNGLGHEITGVTTCAKCSVVGVGVRCWKFRGDPHFYSTIPDFGLPPSRRKGNFSDCDAYKAIQVGADVEEAKEVAQRVSVRVMYKAPLTG